MPAIPLKEAVERLAQAVEQAAAEDLVEYYRELYPANPIPDAKGAEASVLAKAVAAHIREGLEPEEAVDLWNVVFPVDRRVSYDEEADTLRYEARRPRFAEP